MRKMAQVVRRESVSPAADFWQRIRVGLAVFILILAIKWVLQ